MACEYCGRSRGEIQWSHSAAASVCLPCHLQTTPPEDDAAERIALQHEIARAVRSTGHLGRALEDRALLIETASSADEVIELLDEVERLGVKVEGRP